MNPNDFAPVIVTTVLTVCVATWLILRGPIGKALARRIEGQAGNADFEARTLELERRITQLEHADLRVQELEERLDFAERLLAQREGAGRIGGGS